MRKHSLPFSFLAFVISTVTSFAQEKQKFEIFGGYSNLRQETNVPALVPPNLQGAGNGVAASAAYNLTETFGIGIDWSRHWFDPVEYEGPYGLPDGSTSSYRIDGEQSRQDFFIGPRLRVLKHGPLRVSLKAGVGVIGFNSDYTSVQPGLTEGDTIVFDVDKTEWEFASSFGGSFDLDLSRNLSWRIAQPEVIYWRDGDNRTDFKVSTGLVFRFGGR